MATTYNLVPIWDIPFRDLNGEILSFGKVYTWKAIDHATPKPVYEDSTGATVYPNPIILDARGCIPGTPYWASDENYFVELKEFDETPVKSIDNYNASWINDPTPGHEEVDFTNYMLNAQLRLPLQLKFENIKLPASSTILAEEGWTFYRDNTSANVEIEFLPFSPGQTTIPNNPKYWVQFKSNTTGTAEIEKDFRFNVGDVDSFSGETVQFALWAWSSLSSTIEIIVRQFFGSGGSTAVETTNAIALINAETQYQISIDIPSVSGKTITEDNRLEIIVRMPLNQISNINFTNAQLNRGILLLEFNYKSYEQERTRAAAYLLPIPTDDDIYGSLYWDSENHQWSINTETGKVGWFLLSEAPVGYLPMDGSTYVRTGSIANTNITYERLYNVWENDSTLLSGNAFGYGDDGFFPYVFNNVINFNNTFPNNITNWTDVDTGFTINLINTGNSLGLLTTDYELLYDESQQSPLSKMRIINNYNGNSTNINVHTSGFTVSTVQQGSGSLPEISLFETIAGTGLAGLYFSHGVWNITSNLNVGIWFTVDGVGTQPVDITIAVWLLVALFSTDTAEIVAEKTKHALNGWEQTNVTCLAASALSGGEYFYYYSDSEDFYLWIRKDGTGTDPSPPTTIGVVCDIEGTDTDIQVAQKVAKAISSYYFVVPDYRGYFVRLSDNGSGNDPEVNTRIGNGAAFNGDKVGTFQQDVFKSHYHKYLASFIVNGSLIIQQGTSARHGSYDTESKGGLETRPKNRYLNAFVKF